MIDHWFKTAADRDAYKINGTLSGNGAILVENATRKNQFARRIEITIIKQMTQRYGLLHQYSKIVLSYYFSIKL